MIFEIKPILDIMLSFYEKPISTERFNAYIKLLNGSSKSDLQLPISGYNPMAKKHLTDKIRELKSLKAELLMTEVLTEINSHLISKKNNEIIEVVINIADDLKGGWTNYYTTDFDSKFKLNALVNRNFCTPYFWSSETYTKDLIVKRTKEYIFRTLYWINHGKLKALKDYVNQERFVQSKMNEKTKNSSDDFLELKRYFNEHQNSDDYNLIFNFFYGDTVCEKLNYPKFGIGNFTGFDFTKSFF